MSSEEYGELLIAFADYIERTDGQVEDFQMRAIIVGLHHDQKRTICGRCGYSLYSHSVNFLRGIDDHEFTEVCLN